MILCVFCRKEPAAFQEDISDTTAALYCHRDHDEEVMGMLALPFWYENTATDLRTTDIFVAVRK